jgi:hypothetical protein
VVLLAIRVGQNFRRALDDAVMTPIASEWSVIMKKS